MSSQLISWFVGDRDNKIVGSRLNQHPGLAIRNEQEICFLRKTTLNLDKQ
jgi:hypothetical protein